MPRTFTKSLSKIQSLQCVISDGRILVKSTGEVVTESGNRLIELGLIEHVGGGHVRVTKNIEPSKVLVRKAKAFILKHGPVKFIDRGWVARDGARLSEFAGNTLVGMGLLVPAEDGEYDAPVTMLKVCWK